MSHNSPKVEMSSFSSLIVFVIVQSVYYCCIAPLKWYWNNNTLMNPDYPGQYENNQKKNAELLAEADAINAYYKENPIEEDNLPSLTQEQLDKEKDLADKISSAKNFYKHFSPDQMSYVYWQLDKDHTEEEWAEAVYNAI